MDSASGVDLPAAVIVEPLQMEGGIFPAPAPWLRRLREVTSEFGVPLVLDEIQAGCGRTGTFFCFEQAGIRPDMVTLSKSISGYGYPMSVLLMAPELDVWAPGEHSGTFRGNQLAFVAGAAALDFWEDPEFLARLDEQGRRLQEFGQSLTAADSQVPTRGAGMLLGIDFGRVGGTSRAAAVQRECFNNKLLVEVCGRDDEVVKLMPPLNVDDDTLEFLAQLDEQGRRLQEFGQSLTATDSQVPTRGAGMVLGIDFGRVGGTNRAAAVQRECFDNGLIVEVCGRDDEVVKLMPPLNVDDDTLKAGFEIVRAAMLSTAPVTS